MVGDRFLCQLEPINLHVGLQLHLSDDGGLRSNAKPPSSRSFNPSGSFAKSRV